MIKHGHARLRRFLLNKLEQVEAQNTKTLEFMEKDPGGDFLSSNLSMLETFPEPAVRRYIAEALLETGPEEARLSEAAAGVAFFHLKTVLDALIRSGPGQLSQGHNSLTSNPHRVPAYAQVAGWRGSR